MKRLLTILILLLPTLLFAQERQEYTVSEFTGGLNLVTDSIDLKPNEAIKLDNFVLDRFGALHKRYGVDVWNDSLISADTIKDIHYVEDKNGGKTMFIATNNHIYKLPDWTDTVDVWAGKEVDYTTGRVVTDTTAATGHTKGIFGVRDSTGWLLVADIGDEFIIGDSTYTIDSIFADTMVVVTTVVDLHDSTSYRLVKTVKGNPQLTSWNGNLYVADSESEPWWYDGTTPALLGVVDSGFVDSVGVTSTAEAIYNTGTVFVTGGTNTASVGTAEIDSIIVGDYFHIKLTIHGRWGSTFEYSSNIIDKDGVYFYMADEIHQDNFYPPFDIRFILQGLTELPEVNQTYSLEWWVAEIDIPRSSENTAFIMDSTKSWRTNEFTHFWIVNGNNAKLRGLIGGNEKDVAYYDSSVTFAENDKYYIVWQIPSMRSVRTLVGYRPGGSPIYEDSIVVNSVRFKEITFHRNRLYAIGEEISGIQFEDNSEGDTVATGRVWMSDLGMPTFIPSDFNFDISGAARSSGNLSLYSHDAAQNMFTLRDDLYITTNSNIYRVSDEPETGPEDLFVTQAVHGVGTKQPNGVVTTRDNVAFIMNQQGIWKFDGYNIEKISYKIDPLVERYRGSRMTASKFKDNLLFSFPDSNKTVVMHYPTRGFTLWDIGMLTVNNQAIAIDSNYFVFAQSEASAYVLKYPRSYTADQRSDIFDPTDTVLYAGRYRSGWITSGLLQSKAIEDIEITAYNSAVSIASGNYLRLHKDFAYSSQWDSTAFAGGNPIHNFDNIGNSGVIWGKAFQVEVADSTSQDFYLSNYLLRWYPLKQSRR